MNQARSVAGKWGCNSRPFIRESDMPFEWRCLVKCPSSHDTSELIFSLSIHMTVARHLLAATFILEVIILSLTDP
jgi:hypothetical protein